MNSRTETQTKYETVFSQLPNALKITGAAGSICGFIYLFAYTLTNQKLLTGNSGTLGRMKSGRLLADRYTLVPRLLR